MFTVRAFVIVPVGDGINCTSDVQPPGSSVCERLHSDAELN